MSSDYEALRIRANEARSRLATVEGSIEAAKISYRADLDTLSSLGIEVQDKQNIDLSALIEEYRNKAREAEAEAETILGEVEQSVLRLEGEVERARLL